MYEEKKVPFNKIVAYLRKSRADGDTETVEEVLAKHEKILQEYMLRCYNAELPQKCIFREIMSGETIAARPVVQQIISMIQDGVVEGVFVVDLQRLSRGDLSDAGEFSRLFRYSGCLIITPGRTFDITDEYDRKFFETELMRGNDYLEYTKKIMLRGRIQSTKSGNYVGSVPPYGYDKTFVDKRSTLIPNPVEADIVKLIFDLYTSDMKYGPQLIANKLNDMGYKARKGDIWTPYVIKGIVENPVYIGKVVWNRRKAVAVYQDGKLIKKRPRNHDYIIADGIHEPLISEETFNKAKDIIKSRAHPASRTDRKNVVNPLLGILHCRCGYVMTYKITYSDPNVSPVYMCPRGGKLCDCRGALVDRVIEELYNALNSTLVKLKIELAEDGGAVPDSATVLIDAYNKELADLKKQQSRLYDLLEKGIYSEDIFIERSKLLKERHEKITSELTELTSVVKSDADRQLFVTNLEKCVKILKDSSIEPEEKNVLLKTIINRIEYSRDKSSRRKYDDTPITLKVYYNI